MAGTPRTTRTTTKDGDEAVAVTKHEDAEKVQTKDTQAPSKTSADTSGNVEVVKAEAEAKDDKVPESDKETEPVKVRAKVLRSTNFDTTGLEGTFVTPDEAVKDGKVVDKD